MKNIKIQGLVSFIIILFLSNASYAKSKWWEKLFSKDDDISELSIGEIGGAFKQALTIGAENVVDQLGQVDGFNTDQDIHIPLPKNLKKAKKILKKVGLSDMVDDLETKINRAAEKATPVAKEIFIQSIQDMTFEDVKKIYKGEKDSATLYFKEKMSTSLSEKMTPIIENSLSEVGAIKSLNKVIDKYEKIPFVSEIAPNLTHYVVEQGMNGIFYYLAKQEAEIRQNPLKQSTELLKKVFGKNK